MIRFLPPDAHDQMPAASAVRDLYFAAASEPPLNESKAVAALFADLYDAALKSEAVSAAIAYEEDKLTAFVYGYPWRWDEQQDDWSAELKTCLGSTSELLDGAHALLLLARDPAARGAGTGRRVLEAWLTGMGNGPSWLQTTDLMSPARRLYETEGFKPVGHGPPAPDGKPGLVMYRGGDLL